MTCTREYVAVRTPIFCGRACESRDPQLWLQGLDKPSMIGGSHMSTWNERFVDIAFLAMFVSSSISFAQSPVGSCNDSPQPAFCSAVSGSRSQGWLPQGRSEVMAQHGIVATSQPLAAQAGLQILRHGGNAIDAAVATAAMLNVTEPMMVGMGGDLFALVYAAKEHKVFVLNASGTAPTGATVDRFNKLGYAWNPKNWGPGSGMPAGGIL